MCTVKMASALVPLSFSASVSYRMYTVLLVSKYHALLSPPVQDLATDIHRLIEQLSQLALVVGNKDIPRLDLAHVIRLYPSIA